MKPSLGRIVIYNATEGEQKKMKALDDSGKGCNVQKQLPAVVVAVWGEQPTEESVVNLKVMLDGSTCLWVTSAHQGTEPGQWQEPVRV